MTRTEFLAWCRARVRLLDGATGSNFRKAGLRPGVCAEAWALAHPQTVRALQESYLAAGSEMLCVPSFGANEVLLRAYGLEGQVQQLNRALAELTRECVQGRALVAGDMTTTGRPVLPEMSAEYQKLLDVYSRQAEALLEGGADVLLVETLMGLTEAMAAVEAIRALSAEVPVLCSFSVQADGHCYFDGDCAQAAEILPELGADAIGVNCSFGPDMLESVVLSMRAQTELPILCKPNAGLPRMLDTGEAVYSVTPEAFSRAMLPLHAAGAGLLGGCCGTDARFIRSLRDAVFQKQ